MIAISLLTNYTKHLLTRLFGPSGSRLSVAPDVAVEDMDYDSWSKKQELDNFELERVLAAIMKVKVV